MSPKPKVRRGSVFWLVPVGVGLALWAMWSLVTAPPERARVAEPAEAPSGEIGDASRAALRDILREAEREGAEEEGTR